MIALCFSSSFLCSKSCIWLLDEFLYFLTGFSSKKEERQKLQHHAFPQAFCVLNPCTWVLDSPVLFISDIISAFVDRIPEEKIIKEKPAPRYRINSEFPYIISKFMYLYFSVLPYRPLYPIASFCFLVHSFRQSLSVDYTSCPGVLWSSADLSL